MRQKGLLVHRFRFKETGGSTIRPIGIENPFYFATKHAVSKDLRMFFGITLKFGKKMLRISVPKIVNALPICPKFFK